MFLIGWVDEEGGLILWVEHVRRGGVGGARRVPTGVVSVHQLQRCDANDIAWHSASRTHVTDDLHERPAVIRDLLSGATY